ncbi:glycosyltransferase family 2 protein [Halostagnicola larsenii]|uniref:glycosyltransferase family 2 protein n=1 Tax=Halostagnicola larsenii TaxID=353800 RepID=UPI000A009F07|nr:glycosyltransferase family A protein [Halostagnicola larsenii]
MKSTEQEITRPTVSVIIPSYNRFRRTQRSVDSVAQQSYPNIELIVVDDGSDRELEEVLSIPDDVFTQYYIIRHEANRGANAARNTGVRSASGKYISFLDSDDEFHDGYLETVVNTFESTSPDCAGVYTSYVMVYDQGDDSISEVIEGKTVIDDIIVRNKIGSFSSVTIRRDILIRLGLLDESLPSKQDYDIYLRILKEGYFLYGVSDPLVNHHIHENRISSDISAKKAGKSKLYEKHSDILDKRWLSNSLLTEGFQMAKQGDIHNARRKFCRAIRNNPKNIRGYPLLFLSLFGSQAFQNAIKLVHRWQ